jgi:small subunit ribosomal protein S9
MSKKVAKEKIIQTSGKRKRAVARATTKKGSGIIRVNKKLLTMYEPRYSQMKIMEALLLAGDAAKDLDISVSVRGGGINAQAEAARLAIAKGILGYSGDKKLKAKFLEYDRHLLINDTRRREPSKPNNSSPRGKRQKSYR